MYSSGDVARSRARNPVVKVSLQRDPNRVLSLTVPKSKSWEEFLEKCAQRFEFDVRDILDIYEIIDEGAEPLRQGDTMKKVKHGTTFQIHLSDFQSSSEEEVEMESDSLEDEEIFRQPFDIFQRLSHLKKKHQIKRREAWKSCNRKEWTLCENESDDSMYTFQSEEFRMEISRKLIRKVPEIFRLSQIRDQMICIILCHGGAFAAAIFRGAQLLQSKKFQRYVVRKKQGQRQMTWGKGSMGKGSTGGSAGGWLRSLQEKKLHEDITELLSSWRDSLAECDILLIHAPGSLNQSTVFGENTPLERDDERILKLPIQRNVVNSSEVKKIHFAISTANLIQIMDSAS